MAPSRVIVAYRGVTLDEQWTHKTATGDIIPTPPAARLQVRPTYGSSTLILSATTEDDDADPHILLGGDDGTVQLVVPAAVMATVGSAVGTVGYRYDLQLLDDSGEVVEEFLSGMFIVRPTVIDPDSGS